MSEDIYRLKKLLEHWIEHNEDHSAKFRQAAEDAAKMGLRDVANDIQLAAEKGSEVTKYLRNALALLE